MLHTDHKNLNSDTMRESQDVLEAISSNS